MEGRDETCEDTEDTLMLLRIEEEKYAIRKLSFVTVLSTVRGVKGKEQGIKGMGHVDKPKR